MPDLKTLLLLDTGVYKDGEWDESKHPRSEGGKFAAGTGTAEPKPHRSTTIRDIGEDRKDAEFFHNGESVGHVNLLTDLGPGKVQTEDLEIWKEYRGKGHAVAGYENLFSELRDRGYSEAQSSDMLREGGQAVWESLRRKYPDAIKFENERFVADLSKFQHTLLLLDTGVYKDGEWDESKHPRGAGGKFGAGTGAAETKHTVGAMTYREPAKPETPFESKQPPNAAVRQRAEAIVADGRAFMKEHVPGFEEARERSAWAENRMGRIEKVMKSQWNTINKIQAQPAGTGLGQRDSVESANKFAKATKELDDATKRMGYAQQRLEQANAEVRDKLGEWVRGAVGDTRPINASIDPNFTPTQRQNIREGIKAFENITGGSSADYSYSSRAMIDFKWMPPGGRAFYRDFAREIHLTNNDDKATVVHELGHWFEDNNNNALEAVKDWMAYRTAGEAPVNLKQFTHLPYEPHETALIDKFTQPYIGAQYGKGSEVLSMGFQYLYENAGAFYKRDPDHFMFTMGVIARTAKEHQELKAIGASSLFGERQSVKDARLGRTTTPAVSGKGKK